MSKPVPEQPEMWEISFDESPPRNSVLNKTIENSLPEGDLFSSTANLYSLDRTKSRSAISTQTVSTAYEHLTSDSTVKHIYERAARLDRLGMGMLRLGLVIVLVWIGGLKFASYEADGIVPLVANSPFLRFLYHHPPPEYREHMNKEGQIVPANQQWNESNGTYPVSYGLGAIIISLGIMIALYPIWPQVSAMGSFLLILMALTTLSFLVTTPEAWVPALGDPHHGFPYLSGAGRLVVKDCVMLGAAILTTADAAKTYLRRNSLRLSVGSRYSETNSTL